MRQPLIIHSWALLRDYCWHLILLTRRVIESIMKTIVVILLITHCSLFIMGQEIPPNTEQQLENLTDADQTETEDDSYVVQLQYFKKHPLNLNAAGADDLKELFFLTDLQIENLLSYRRLLGKFISIYELQAIPA